MKHASKHLITGVLGGALLAFTAGSASAALIAEESFDYAAGIDNLANQGSSGGGWDGGWTNDSDGSVTSPGFDYTDSNSDSLVVAGNKANVVGTSSSKAAFRDLDSTLTPTAANPIWVSVIMESNTSNARFFALSFTNGGSPVTSIGADGTSAQNWRIQAGDGSGTVVSGTDTENKALLVAKFTGIKADLFINPNLNIEPTTADVSESFTSIGDFDGVRLFAGGASNPADADFDEIRIGTTFRSVAPIPEPATVGLVLLGGAVLLGRRGRGHRDVGLHA